MLKASQSGGRFAVALLESGGDEQVIRKSEAFAAVMTATLFCAAPALAQDEAFEFWLNPSIGTDLDEDTAIELETAQRLRSSADGRADTYYYRFWVKQKIAGGFTLGGAVEKRYNDPGSNEVRTMQQISKSFGIIKTRARLEQRFSEGADQMGLRLRTRGGVGMPISADGRWSFGASAEPFWTLRPRREGGDTGLTSLETKIGVAYEVSDNFELSLDYLRAQAFEDNAPDEIGHAPLVGLSFTF